MPRMATGNPRGRPRIPGKLKRIKIRDSVFKKWREIKQASGFNNSTDNEFAEVLLYAAVNGKVVRSQEACSTSNYGATSSSADTQSEETSTLNTEENQSQIVINIDIIETDKNQSSVSEGSSATGDPVPKVIVTSFNPKADSSEAAFSKAAEHLSSVCEESLQNSDVETTDEETQSMTSSDAEVLVDVETCDVANPKGLSWFKSSPIDSESSDSSSEIEVVEVETASSQKRKKGGGSDDLLAKHVNEGFDFVDPLSEETLFGVELTNYQQKLSTVEDSIEKIKQERGEIEMALNLKDAKKKLLKKELALLRKEISAKRTNFEELQKKEDLLYKEKSNLKNKVVHCETLKSEYEVKKARLK